MGIQLLIGRKSQEAMMYPVRWFSIFLIFCLGIFLGGMVLAMGEMGSKKLPLQGLGNWEFEVTGSPNRPSLVIRGFNLESARYVSRVNTEVKGNGIIVEVFSSFIHPFVKRKVAFQGRRNKQKPISFEKEVVLPSPVLPEYSIYYRDIDGTLHLIQKVQISNVK